MTTGRLYSTTKNERPGVMTQPPDNRLISLISQHHRDRRGHLQSRCIISIIFHFQWARSEKPIFNTEVYLRKHWGCWGSCTCCISYRQVPFTKTCWHICSCLRSGLSEQTMRFLALTTEMCYTEDCDAPRSEVIINPQTSTHSGHWVRIMLGRLAWQSIENILPCFVFCITEAWSFES